VHCLDVEADAGGGHAGRRSDRERHRQRAFRRHTRRFALDAATSALQWKVGENHPDAVITGGLAFHTGPTPVSQPRGTAVLHHPCCTFQGAVSLDAAGRRIQDPPSPRSRGHEPCHAV
jgi:hypothetical protein